MSVEELKSLLLEANPKKIANWFAGKSESERAKLRKPIEAFQLDLARWHEKKSYEVKILEELETLGYDQSQGKDLLYKFQHGSLPLDFFELACRPPSKLKDLNFSLSDENVEEEWGDGAAWDKAMIKILEDRKLEKIDRLIGELLELREREAVGDIDADFVLLAVEKGIVRQPDSVSYLTCLAEIFDRNWSEGTQWERNQKLLKKNKAFLERDAYLLLQTETDLLWNPDKERFKELYDSLMKSRKLSRAKVIESVLHTLFLDLKKNVLQGAVRYLGELAPTPNELKASLDDLKGLLGSEHSFVGKFAVEAIKTLHEDGGLETQIVLESLSSVFRCPTKGTPKTAIGWIKKIAKANDELVPHAINAVLPALEHTDADVQAAGLKWLDSIKKRLHQDHLNEIEQLQDQLAATNRKLARSIVESSQSKTVKPKKATEAKSKSQVKPKSQNSTSEPYRPSSDPTTIRSQFDINNYEKIVPIETHQELIDATARGLEVVENGSDAERLLDGLSRLGPVPDEFEKQAEPILQTALSKNCSMYSSGGEQGFTSAPDATQRTRRIACLALGMKELLEPPPTFADEEEAQMFGYSWPPEPQPMELPEYLPEIEQWNAPDEKELGFAWRSRLFWQRLESIEQRFDDGIRAPLICAPTHQHGWIEPVTLVERIEFYFRANVTLCPADLCLGLMRLMPVGRERALEKTKQLTKLKNSDAELCSALAIALEGTTEILKKHKQAPVLWQIAAHVRNSKLDAAELTRLGLDSEFANGKLAVLKSWRMNEDKTSKNVRVWKIPFLLHNLELPEWIKKDRVLCAVYRIQKKETLYTSRWRTEIDAWNDPVCRDSFWIEAMTRMVSRLENGPARQDPNAAFLECLFDPGYVWEQAACGAVVIALLGKDTDASSTGIDALQTAISENRVDATVMGEALVRVFNSSLPKVKRFVERYSMVAADSEIHSEFVARTLERLITGWAAPDRNINPGQVDRFSKATECAPILELYLESMTENESIPEPMAMEALSTVTAKGKVAKLLKSILSLEAVV